jgi:hypothetical protein
MSYTFEAAEPVTIQGTGTKKEDNPFAEAVAGIAWKTNESTGKPLALSFVEEHGADDEDVKKIRGRITSLLRRAGLDLDTPGTVRKDFRTVTDAKGKVVGTRVTFWVVELQKRPRIDKTEATAN